MRDNLIGGCNGGSITADGSREWQLVAASRRRLTPDPRYIGFGDPNDAASFRCVRPRQRHGVSDDHP